MVSYGVAAGRPVALTRRVESGDLQAVRRLVGSGASVMWTLNHPDVWHLLVGERGWTAEQHEEWFAESVRSALMR